MPKTINKYFKVDPWNIIEEGFDQNKSKFSESIFSLANEFMAVRGYFEEGYSGDSLQGSYLSGVYYKNLLEDFWCTGLAQSECFMQNSVDWLYTRIIADGEELDLAKSKFTGFKRTLDMKNGTLTRSFTWLLNGGKQIGVTFIRFINMQTRSMGCLRLILDPINFDGDITLKSCLDFNIKQQSTGKSMWERMKNEVHLGYPYIMAKSVDLGQQVFSAFKLDVSVDSNREIIDEDMLVGDKRIIKLEQGKSVTIDKIVVNYVERRKNMVAMSVFNSGACVAADNLYKSFDKMLAQQNNYWADYWAKSDINIFGDDEILQGVRYCLFNLHQTYRGGEHSFNVPAKGMTGELIGGQSRWETETHVMPYYLFSNPDLARKLLETRYKQLPQAVERGIETGCKGARFPLYTIDGTESCVWWEHSMLQIHINGGIAHAIKHYVTHSGDKQFLYDKGLEILLQICRYFADRGKFSQHNGDFGFYGVMGPDELNMMVSHNYYTNLMAKKAFEYTFKVLEDIKKEASAAFELAVSNVNLDMAEVEDWKIKSDKMRILKDDSTEVIEQHDGFFDLPHLDIDTIPKNQFPVEQHWAYDRIFRYDMIRQPEILLLMVLYGQEYTKEQKQVNFDYYEPRCSHESSLSPAIHSCLAAELGDLTKAIDYARFASRLDLDDYNGNTNCGLHVSSMAGTWLNIVYGFGGLRTDGEMLSFAPTIPEGWQSYSFSIKYLDMTLNVDVTKNHVVFTLNGGTELMIKLYGNEVKLSEGKNKWNI